MPKLFRLSHKNILWHLVIYFIVRLVTKMNAILIRTRRSGHVYWCNRPGNNIKSDNFQQANDSSQHFNMPNRRSNKWAIFLRSISLPLIEGKCRKICAHVFVVFYFFCLSLHDTQNGPRHNLCACVSVQVCCAKDDVVSSFASLSFFFSSHFKRPVVHIRITEGNLLCNGINVCFTHSQCVQCTYIPKAFRIKYYMLLTLNEPLFHTVHLWCFYVASQTYARCLAKPKFCTRYLGFLKKRDTGLI